MKYKFGKKFLIKPQMTKSSQDINGIIISIILIFQSIFTEMPLFEVVNGNSPLLDTF